LGQIDLNISTKIASANIDPASNPTSGATYYPIRLKVQEVSGLTMPSATSTNYYTLGTGLPINTANPVSGVKNINYINWKSVSTIESASNGKLYFTKTNSPILYAINNPDVAFTNINLLPVDIFAGQTTTNITLSNNVATLPDAVDQEDYMTATPCPALPCTSCVGSFAPTVGKRYVLTAWARQDNATGLMTTFAEPQISVEFTTLALPVITCTTSGPIIDGWQRIEKEFSIPGDPLNLSAPGTATDIKITLKTTGGDVYFDDIRVHPKDGSMKSYVYDPVTLRLSAELDERNYATFYEYDEEGKLIRVKKETERGVMTIKENRNNTKKQ
jgi:hypothetical protein